ncbi:MAG: EAL domain-containing protein [Clostridia bacterium]|nr:EAL domain-containing protein [Clostridia bacterium]
MIYRYLARQPIVDMNRKLYGYEMLYRGGEDNFFPAQMDQNAATKDVISSLQTEFALKDVSGGKCAFINLPKDICMSTLMHLLAPSDFVIEILEDTQVDKPFVDRIANLKEKGYRFALDDYIGQPCFDPILPFVEIIKVDFVLASDAQKSAIVRAHRKNKRVLAEKIETKEQFEWAKRMGYSLFQGYYFSRPLVLRKETLNVATVTHMKLWQLISENDPSYERIAEIIIKDAGMTYKLLNKINTMEFFRANRVFSVPQALARMGTEGIRRWIMLVLLQDCIPEEDDAYVKLALTRALFAEHIMRALGEDDYANDAYMVGMFSVFDNSLDTALSKFLHMMHASPRVVSALLRHKDVLGGILTLSMQYEVGGWGEVDAFAQKTRLAPERLTAIYRQAVSQAEDAFTMAAM